LVVGAKVKGPVWFGLENLNEDADAAVLLASFNRPTMVIKAIESVLKQTYDWFNLYILDNNSLPEVKDVLLRYRHVPRVALYFSNTQAHERLDKYWLGAMVNIGVKKGRELYLQSLTDDCYLLPHSLETKVAYMKEHPEVRLCFGAQYIVNNAGNILRIRNQFPRDHKIVKGSCVVDLCQTMFHRALVEEAGYFNEVMDRKPYPWIDALMFEEAQTRGIPLFSVGKRTDVFIEHGKSQMVYLREGRRNELLSDEIWE